MTDRQKLILSFIILIAAIAAFIVFTVITRKKESYRKEILKELDEKTYAYFRDLQPKEGKYFPYYETHAAGLRHSASKKGEKDDISGIQLKPHYGFYQDRMIYIINNNLHYPMELIESEHQKYIHITEDIQMIEVLVSFERPSHFLARYKVKKTGDNKFRLELMEEEQDDE